MQRKIAPARPSSTGPKSKNLTEKKLTPQSFEWQACVQGRPGSYSGPIDFILRRIIPEKHRFDALERYVRRRLSAYYAA